MQDHIFLHSLDKISDFNINFIALCSYLSCITFVQNTTFHPVFSLWPIMNSLFRAHRDSLLSVLAPHAILDTLAVLMPVVSKRQIGTCYFLTVRITFLKVTLFCHKVMLFCSLIQCPVFNSDTCFTLRKFMKPCTLTFQRVCIDFA